jgi:hypothetical protein
MNNRIQELKQQATHDILGVKVLNAEKFAELIIQECLEVVEKQIGGGNGDGVEWDRAVDFTYNDIKSYFGVER